MSPEWGKVEVAVELARGVAFDDCHKIYVLFDDEQVNQMRGYGYTTLITDREMSPSEMFDTIRKWYADSCGLRFVSGVRTVEGDPNDGFVSLVPQF